MRSPRDLPRRRTRTRRSNSNRWRIVLIVAVAILILLLLSLRGLAGFYTDYLWFDSLRYSDVFTSVLRTRLLLAVGFSLVFAAILWVNLFVADRLAPRLRINGPEEEFIQRYHDLVGRRAGIVRIGLSLLLGLIAGVGTSSQWSEWLLFVNSVDFGVDDAQFGRDVGFYVFQLPFLQFVVSWLFTSMVVVTIVTVVAHYLNGGIRVQGAGRRVTPAVKAHVSVLLGALALIKAAGYYLQQFGLVFSERGFVNGAGYTDVKAQLPAIRLLILISIAAFVILLVNIRQKGWVLPVLAVGLWGIVAVVAGAIYPAIVQRFQVQPAESTRERPYIQRNIEATRAALGLDQVESQPFALDEELTAQELSANRSTLANVRLVDPALMLPTFQRVQGIRNFYEFNDLDVDRYELDGQVTQVVLGARELNSENLPLDSWEGRHLAYTHGYGVAMASANRVDSTGRPSFLIRNLPPTGQPELTEPAIYFGENLPGYAIVDTARSEVDYVDVDGNTVSRNYQGGGGVSIGSFFRKAAFALRFWTPNPLLSDFITSDSKILYVRDVRERVELLAPFLHFDADPYPIVVDGQIVWMIDAYTTTDEYPYAQNAITSQLPSGSGLRHEFNYVRNSVKAVVNAYDGQVTFYVVDDEDPLIRAWSKAFPDLFVPGDEMPAALRAHMRYPEDLFRVQTAMWGRYHIDDPGQFYSGDDMWNVAQDPPVTVGAAETTQTTDAQGRLGRPEEFRIDPYYLLMKLPNETREKYVLLRSFVPFSPDDSRRELQAFMTASSDPEDYGRLQVFVMPRDRLPDGPSIVASSINQETEIATEINVLNREGSRVLFGNLQLVPIENSLLYVRPLYTQAVAGSGVPELQRVIVTFGGESVMEDTLEEALAVLFGESPDLGGPTTLPEEPEPPVDGEEPPDGGEEPEPPERTASELLAEAQELFVLADEALRSGDLAAYQTAIEEARELVEEALELMGGPPTTVPPESDDEGGGDTTVVDGEAPVTTLASA